MTGAQSLFINGRRISVNLTSDAALNRAEIVAKVAAAFGDGGIRATDNQSGITLTSTDGRNLSVWYDSSVASLGADNFGLNSSDVVGIAGAATDSHGAKTIYAGVSLSATVPDAPKPRTAAPAGSMPSDGLIQIATGKNGYGETSNFTSLGFVEGTFGGKSSVEISPPRVGRLTFQIGASAGQVVTIDLADYGSQGPITGELTGDIGALVPTIEVGTVQGANSVLSVLDRAMDKVTADRAKMGAVMNRLAPLWEQDDREFTRLVDANIRGVQNVIRHFVPAMVKRAKGVIVNLSSGWGRSVSPEVAPYCMSKWAIEGLTQALAEEIAPAAVDVIQARFLARFHEIDRS
mgnify:CR=1 FL=1